MPANPVSRSHSQSAQFAPLLDRLWSVAYVIILNVAGAAAAVEAGFNDQLGGAAPGSRRNAGSCC